MSSRRHRSQLLAATLLIHLHSLMREKTGMITDLWRKRKKPPVPTVLGERAAGGFGPSGAIVSEPESDYQLRRGSRR
jgi:hypothetical protein